MHTRYDENYKLIELAWRNAVACGVALPSPDAFYAWGAIWHHPNADRRPVVVLPLGHDQAAFLMDDAGGCNPDLSVVEAWQAASALFPLSVVPDVVVYRPAAMPQGAR